MVIRKAADILAAKGWCQQYYTSGGRVCSSMALIDADTSFGGNALQRANYLKALDYFRRFTGALSLPAWNDLYATTYEDVQTANLAEQEGD
jgi:hypothetical protein